MTMVKVTRTSLQNRIICLKSLGMYNSYLPGGRFVLEKTVPEVLSEVRGRRPRVEQIYQFLESVTFLN